MKIRRLLGLVCIAVAAMPPFGSAAVKDPPPQEAGLVEKVEVGLVILDVLVLDRKGNPVPGLVAEDFDVEVDQRPVGLVSLDDSCREVVQKPNIVLAFDYQHLNGAQRGQILEDVRNVVQRDAPDAAAVMVVALTGGLRVEQPFTRDLDRVQLTLGRMRNDVSLWAGNFTHKNEDGFVRGLTSLFDVAGTFPGRTAVILYSGMRAAPLEEQFRQLAAQAAAARCEVYPFNVEGLTTGPPPSKGPRPAFRGDTKTAPPLVLPDDESDTAIASKRPDQPAFTLDRPPAEPG